MDKILINNMQFYGYHGVFPEENVLGQRYLVDLTLHVDLAQAGKTDSLDNTVNYASVYSLVKQIVEGKPFKLIEAVAEVICAETFSAFPLVHGCTVKVIKPNPPINGHYDSVAVEITRERS